MRKFTIWIAFVSLISIMLFSCANAAGGGGGGSGMNYGAEILLSDLEGKYLAPYDQVDSNGRTTMTEASWFEYYYYITGGEFKIYRISDKRFTIRSGYQSYDERTAQGTPFRSYNSSTCQNDGTWRCPLFRARQLGEFIALQNGDWIDDGTYDNEENSENIDISSCGNIHWNSSFHGGTIYKLTDHVNTINWYANGADNGITETYLLPPGMKFDYPYAIDFGVATPDGYTFEGWDKASAAETVEISRIGSPLKSVNEDTNFYAVWSYPATYTITFYGNGTQFSDHGTKKETVTQTLSGNGINGIFTYPFKTLYDLGIYFCERAGFTHVGWAKNPTSAVIEYKDPDKITLDSDTNLYAVWKCPKSHKITFNANGGSLSKDSQLATADCLEFDPNIPPVNISLKTASDLNLSRSGYRFRGWALQNDAEDVLYQDGASLTVSEDMTLYALWDKEVTYTITYVKNASGATIETETQSILGTELTGVHGEIKSANELGLVRLYQGGPSRYLLKGWARTASGERAYVSGQNIDLTEDITLYAVWYLPKYTVSFSNATTSNPSREITGYGGTTTLPSAGTKSGYTFKCWKCGDNTFAAGQTVSIYGDSTFTAIWTENCYYIQLYYPASGATLIGMGYDLVSTSSSVDHTWSYNTKNSTYSPAEKITGPRQDINITVGYKDSYHNQTVTHSWVDYTFQYGKTYIINVVTGGITVQ